MRLRVHGPRPSLIFWLEPVEAAGTPGRGDCERGYARDADSPGGGYREWRSHIGCHVPRRASRYVLGAGRPVGGGHRAELERGCGPGGNADLYLDEAAGHEPVVAAPRPPVNKGEHVPRVGGDDRCERVPQDIRPLLTAIGLLARHDGITTFYRASSTGGMSSGSWERPRPHIRAGEDYPRGQPISVRPRPRPGQGC